MLKMRHADATRSTVGAIGRADLYAAMALRIETRETLFEEVALT